MKISKINSSPVCKISTNKNINQTSPTFKAGFNMHTNVLYYHGKESYWKDVLERLIRFIKPIEPKSATISLEADSLGNAKVYCTHPSVQGAMVKDVGNLENPNIVNNVYEAANTTLRILRECGYK